MYRNLFIHSFIDGLMDFSGCFQFLVIANKAVVNICVQISAGQMFQFLLGKCLGVHWLGHVIR